MEHLERYCSYHEGGRDFFRAIFPYDNRDFWISGVKPEIREKLCLGRLSLKEEGAGKVRVFAIADAITQSVLCPLHKWVFNVLRRLPMDGTFDQLGPLKLLQQKLREGQLVGQTIYSYDLSAATDRLPIRVQRDILALLFGEQFSID